MAFALEISQFGGRHLAIWLHPSQECIPQPEWTAAIERIVRYTSVNGLEPGDLCSLVISDGATPNPKQRAELARSVWKGERMSVSVVGNVLDTPIRRGVATAMRWLNPAIRFYGPSEFRQALAHLGLEHACRRVWSTLLDMQSSFSHNATIWAIAQSLEPASGSLCSELG